MPLGITNHPAPSPSPDPVFPGTLPEEVYVRVECDDHDKAKNWCESVTDTLARPILELGSVRPNRTLGSQAVWHVGVPQRARDTRSTLAWQRLSAGTRTGFNGPVPSRAEAGFRESSR